MKVLALLVLTVFNVAVAFKSVSKLTPMRTKLHMNGKTSLSSFAPGAPMGSVLPMGTESFREVRERGLIYVDKTKAIYDNILNSKLGSSSFEFVRPQGFGKSLLCSTLVECFGGKESKYLFDDLWLGQEDSGWDFEAEAVPVVRLDMSRCAGASGTVETFKAAAKQLVLEQADRLGVKIEDNGAPVRMLGMLLHEVSKKNGNKEIPLLIDDYDKPVLDVLDKPVMEDVRDALNSFYSHLKSLHDTIRVLFFTGQHKLSQHPTHTLNHLSDISLDIEAGALVGYTEEEMQSKLMAGALSDLAAELKMEREPLLASLQDKYGGYKFGFRSGGKLSPSVLCPFAVNSALNSKDVNTDFRDYLSAETRQLIVNRLKDERQAYGPEQLVHPSDLRRSYDDFHSIPLPVLMYSAGYLTIKKYDDSTELLHLAPPSTMVPADVVRRIA